MTTDKKDFVQYFGEYLEDITRVQESITRRECIAKALLYAALVSIYDDEYSDTCSPFPLITFLKWCEKAEVYYMANMSKLGIYTGLDWQEVSFEQAKQDARLEIMHLEGVVVKGYIADNSYNCSRPRKVMIEILEFTRNK